MNHWPNLPTKVRRRYVCRTKANQLGRVHTIENKITSSQWVYLSLIVSLKESFIWTKMMMTLKCSEREDHRGRRQLCYSLDRDRYTKNIIVEYNVGDLNCFLCIYSKNRLYLGNTGTISMGLHSRSTYYK